MVASSGWIIPEPLAMPPTTKPGPAATDSFERVSVVMIACAASPPAAVTLIARAPTCPQGGPRPPCVQRATRGRGKSSRECANFVSNQHPRQPQAERLLEPEREVRVLHRLACRALAEVVLGADDD